MGFMATFAQIDVKPHFLGRIAHSGGFIFHPMKKEVC